MALMVLTASFLSINGVDRSSKTNKVELVVEVEEKDVTTFTSLGWKVLTGGLKSGSVSGGFYNDAADNDLDETMWALLGTVVAFVARLDNAAVSASNPNYSGNILINKWTPIGGAVGDVNAVEFDFPTSGAITRAVA